MLVLAYTISITGMLLLPILLAVALRRRHRVYWILFVAGSLTFIGSQVVHLPLNNWLAQIGVLPESPQLEGAPLWRSALILGLSAGLCEELARAIGYAVIRWARRTEDGVMLGLGHGGIEAMLFGGVLTAATIGSLLNLQAVDLESLNLTAAQLEAILLQSEQLTSSPLYAFAPLFERLLAISAQVTLSIIVLQSFSRKRPLMLLVAILYHALIDGLVVYVAMRSENTWYAWLVFILVLIPGWIWAVKRWRADRHKASDYGDIKPLPIPFRTSLRLFWSATRKELLFLWRTWRIVIVCSVIFVFAILAPLLTKFTPQLLGSLEGAEMFAELIPEMTVTDSLNQHIESMTQFGFILVILVGMGMVAGEKERGTAGMVLSKPLPRSMFISSKFFSLALIYLLAFVIALTAGYYYNLILFGQIDFWGFAAINGLLLLWLLIFTALTLLGSTMGNSTGAAAGFSLGGAIVLLLAGSIPRLGPLLPSGLLAWASQLAARLQGAGNWGAFVLGVVLILIFLVAALGVFERQELQ
jgi:ABC-2 type transport system permease protein